jgi:hypothetical protein
MIPWEDIPEEFRQRRTKWNDIFNTMFYQGLPGKTQIYPKQGINAGHALLHIRAIAISFEPKHEHKEACVAYLFSLWFEDIVIPKRKKKK